MSSLGYGGGLVEVPARVGTPAAPGSESAGPALGPLVLDSPALARALAELLPDARRDLRLEVAEFSAQAVTDSNGDALLELYTVSHDVIGHLMLCCVDEAGVTPGAPDTSADISLSIRRAASPGMTTAGVVATGSMLDCSPASVVANGQIPFPFVYGSPESAPTIRGPGTFYLFVDAATASRQVAARGHVLLRRNDR